MNVIFSDHFLKEAEIKVSFFDGQSISFKPSLVSLDELLINSDYITLHIPAQKKYLIDKEEFSKMKDGVGIVNAARGGVINEESLIDFIDSGKIKFAGLDTFENEPNPSIKTLMKLHFNEYFKEIIIKYNKKELYLTGSIAHYFESEIREVSKKFNIDVMQIEKDPIDHLVNYHVK